MFQEDKLFNIDDFLIELTIFNSYIRELDIHIKSKITFDEIINKKLYGKIFTKGYQRIQELKYFIIDNINQKSLENDKDVLILITKIMSFIVLNQVFGDGNHRTAYFALIILTKEDFQYILTDKNFNFNKDLFASINYLFDNVDYISETALSNNLTYNFTNYKKSYDPINFFNKVSKILYLLIDEYMLIN